MFLKIILFWKRKKRVKCALLYFFPIPLLSFRIIYPKDPDFSLILMMLEDFGLFREVSYCEPIGAIWKSKCTPIEHDVLDTILHNVFKRRAQKRPKTTLNAYKYIYTYYSASNAYTYRYSYTYIHEDWRCFLSFHTALKSKKYWNLELKLMFFEKLIANIEY